MNTFQAGSVLTNVIPAVWIAVPLLGHWIHFWSIMATDSFSLVQLQANLESLRPLQLEQSPRKTSQSVSSGILSMHTVEIYNYSVDLLIT